MSFNKFLKGEKKREKKEYEEQAIRITSIIEEIQSVCSRRGVNYYEMMDILSNMQGALNRNVAKILTGNHNRIKALEEKLRENNIKLDDNRDKSK